MTNKQSAESLWSRQPGIDDLRQMAQCSKTERKDLVGVLRQTERKKRDQEKEKEERRGEERGQLCYLTDVGRLFYDQWWKSN